MYDESKHIKDLIEAMRKEQRLKKGLQKAEIKQLWTELWGEHIAHYTKKVVFMNGILTVYLNSSTLREEMSRQKDKIISLMNEKLGEEAIKKIVLK